MLWMPIVFLVLFLIVLAIAISGADNSPGGIIVGITGLILAILCYNQGSGTNTNSQVLAKDLYKVKTYIVDDNCKYKILKRMSDEQLFFVYIPNDVEDSLYYRIDRNNRFYPSELEGKDKE